MRRSLSIFTGLLGLIITPSAISSPCGGQLYITEKDETFFQSPNYPANFPPETTCAWIFTSPNGTGLLFNSITFDLGDYTERGYHRLEFEPDAGTGYVSHRYAGSISGPELLAFADSEMVVTFYSDYLGLSSGFNISVRAIPLPSDVSLPCGAVITVNSSVTFYSPNYPYEYDENTNCSWTFRAPDIDQKLQIKSSDFGLEGGSCYVDRDYVEVESFGQNEYESFGKFCGDIGPDIPSASGTVRIRFKTDGSGEYRGFNITVSFLPPKQTVFSICGGNQGDPSNSNIYLAENETITLISPNHPGVFPSNLRCGVRIFGGFLKQLLFQTNAFRLEYGCDHDYVEIFDGFYNPLAKFCGDSGPAGYRVAGNEAIVLFDTDDSFSYSGFNITVKALACWDWQIPCPSDENVCISEYQLCDGRKDCPGGSDELNC